MRKIKVSDITMKQKCASELTFREKLELVKILDKLCVDFIEVAPLSGSKADELSLKSMALSLKNASIAVPVGLEKEEIERAWECVKDGKAPRLQVVCPVSSVQLEYLHHLKQDKAAEKIAEAIKYARSLCPDVEFAADDATRSDAEYLIRILKTAIASGANLVSVNDDAGNMTPEEYGSFIENILTEIPELSAAAAPGQPRLGVYCSDQLSLADICTISGAARGASVIKASIYPERTASISNITKIFTVKKDKYELDTDIYSVEINQLIGQVRRIFTELKSKNSPFEDGVRDDRTDNVFTAKDSLDAISNEILRLGYNLSEEDNKNVYDTFLRIAEKKDNVSSREIDAIVASTAMQVPPTYVIKDYIINSGNTITSTCHLRLLKDDILQESVSIGDGPVDASFLAIEQITGHHYELDDFQIQSVTEGRAAMGETLVKLRAGGKLYSGRGISTDVIGSSILAYVNALNKIVYEEDKE